VLGACLALAAQASAQEPSMRLVYRAPAGCPDSEAFTAEVRARAPRSFDLGARAVEVTVTSSQAASPGAAAFEGRVVITDEEGVTPSRAVHGDTCEEVVRALALAVAMTIEPAESGPAPARAGVAPPRPAAATPSAAAPPADEGATPPRERLRVAAGLRGGAESAVGPLLAPTLGVYVDLALGRASLRVGAARAVSPIVERGAGSARFARTTAIVDGCWPSLRAAASLSLAPCATFELGSLTSDGQATVDAESSSRVWAAAGLAGRLAWEPFGPLVLELEARATAPLTRDRFYFRPAEDVFRAPFAAFSGGLTAGVRFR
jgi:hypothetical protein